MVHYENSPRAVHTSLVSKFFACIIGKIHTQKANAMELCESQSKHYRNSIAIKPNVINTPSIFTIEHILSKAGPLKETSPTFAVAADATGEARDRQHLHSHSVSDKSLPLDCHLEQFNQLPPILDWLQYTRYKPPRLPSKL